MRSSRFMGGLAALVALLWGTTASASEAALVLPAFSDFQRQLLMAGLVVCVLGAAFGLVILQQLKNTPVHKSMADISHLSEGSSLIYSMTKTQIKDHIKGLRLSTPYFSAVKMRATLTPVLKGLMESDKVFDGSFKYSINTTR